MEKVRFWHKAIREAARSEMSVREFCRQHKLKESQFYWWQHKLKAGWQERTLRRQDIGRGATSFTLVSDEPGATDAGCASARAWMRRSCKRIGSRRAIEMLRFPAAIR